MIPSELSLFQCHVYTKDDVWLVGNLCLEVTPVIMDVDASRQRGLLSLKVFLVVVIELDAGLRVSQRN